MLKKNLLLKIVSILFIIGGVIAVLSSVFGMATKDAVISGMQDMGYDTAAYESLMSPLSMVIGIVGALVEVAAGVLGVMRKSFKACLITFIVYLVFVIIGIVQTIQMGGVNVLSIALSLVLPVLYAWGLYQAKE